MRSVLAAMALLAHGVLGKSVWTPSSNPAGQDGQAVLSTTGPSVDVDGPRREALKVDVSLGWGDPRVNGGRFLDYTVPLLGEPLNVIVSGLSDPFILSEEGFHHYARSIGYSEECLGLHYGNIHHADLGDGDGRKPEQYLARQYYFPVWGTCWESFAGGHHFRAWRQNGTHADSGAWFIGASKEEHSQKNHIITKDGYNLGRDWFVERAVAGSHWKGQGIWWKAEVEWRDDLIERGNKGVNHGIAQDGRVAILTVNRV